MPFRAEELRQRFAHSIEKGRLGHSYLLTGDRSEALENLALGLAGQVLDAAPQEHPDFHAVRPQSKSRHISPNPSKCASWNGNFTSGPSSRLSRSPSFSTPSGCASAPPPPPMRSQDAGGTSGAHAHPAYLGPAGDAPAHHRLALPAARSRLRGHRLARHGRPRVDQALAGAAREAPRCAPTAARRSCTITGRNCARRPSST